MAKESKKARDFVREEMHEFKKGKLHSSSKKGPIVHDKNQAVAISLNSARKKGMKVPKNKG